MAKKSLRNLSVLITGAASGIGKAIAYRLYTIEKCNLILVDKDFEGLQLVEDELKKLKQSNRIQLFHTDISSKNEVRNLLKQLSTISIDVLINNAGIVSLGDFADKNFENNEKVLTVNLIGTMYLTHSLLPIIDKSNQPSIINVLSIAGYISAPGMLAYSVSKFGLVAFSDALRIELGSRYQVGIVAPTFIKTNLALNANEGGEDGKHKDRMNEYLHTQGNKPEKVAKAVVKLLKYRREKVLVNSEAYFLYYLNRILPVLCKFFVRFHYKKLKQEGIIP